MIQEPYPAWPLPMSLRALCRRARDAMRGFTDADLASYDAKVRAMAHTAPQDLTEAEMRANAARRKRWLRL